MGAHATVSVAPDNSTDAGFRAWATVFHNALTACGWVQTSDTGQINLSTVLKPATAVYQGYEIWRMDDSLQATAPVFMKVEYGALTAAGNPSIRIIVGTGSNGSGTITGTNSSSTTLLAGPGVTGSTTPYDCVYSGATSRFVIAMWLNHATATGSYMFSIERWCDDDGTPNGDGIKILSVMSGATTASTLLYEQDIGYTGGGAGPQYTTSFWYTHNEIVSTTAVHSAAVPLLPIFGVCAGLTKASKQVFAYCTNDLTRATEIDMTVYGASRHYYALGGSYCPSVNAINRKLAILYENAA